MSNIETRVTKINPQGKPGWLPLVFLLLSLFEGMSLVGHHDRIDPPGVNTICIGHIENVTIGEHKTKIECEEMLKKDIPVYEEQLLACIHVPLNSFQHAALLSFVYNLGGGTCQKSSVARYINRGDFKRGCDALLLYNRANGKYVKGLARRRAAERKLCLLEDDTWVSQVTSGSG